MSPVTIYIVFVFQIWRIYRLKKEVYQEEEFSPTFPLVPKTKLYEFLATAKEDEVVEYIRATPHEGFQRDIRVISGDNCKQTTDFDDEDLLDTYVELTAIAEHTNEEVE